MKILILGITGMLGYNSYLILKSKYTIYGTCRKKYDLDDNKIFCFDHTIKNILNVIEKVKPNIILNCIAQLNENNYDEKNSMIFSNCTLPLNLSKFCKENNIYFIHFSTDAIYKKSHKEHKINESYSPESFYGLTKSISEYVSSDSLVLRICPIGFDKFKRKSLFNFIYDNENTNLSGYKNVYFNGTTTIVIINQIIKIIEDKQKIYGIRHITGPKISKYQLLKIINEQFQLNKNITPVNEPHISRLLEDDLIDSSHLDWTIMIKDLKQLI